MYREVEVQHITRSWLPTHPMPLSRRALIRSTILWLVIIIIVVMLSSYFSSYFTLRSNSDLEDCDETLVKTIQHKPVDVSHLEDSATYRNAAQYLNLNSPSSKPISKYELPPFVTAVSSLTFSTIQGLIKQIIEHLRPLYRGKAHVRLIVFDMGMTSAQRDVFERHCSCELRNLDYTKLPDHVRNPDMHSYRAVISQVILWEYGALVWMDPSTRLVAARIPEAITEAKKLGLLIWDYSFPVPSNDEIHPMGFVYQYERLIEYTNPGTFSRLLEKRCRHTRGLVTDSRLMILYNTDYLRKHVIQPWVTCVLDVECVSPKSSIFSGCHEKHKPFYTGCHRYEMSVLGIITNNLIGHAVKRVFQPIIDVPNVGKNENIESEEYFPEQPSPTVSTAWKGYVFTFCVVFVIVIVTSSLLVLVIIKSSSFSILMKSFVQHCIHNCRRLRPRYTYT